MENRNIKSFTEKVHYQEEIKKQQMLFDYLISIGFDKLEIKDTTSMHHDLIVFRHNEYYREQLLSFPVPEINYSNYESAYKFLDDWGYLDDEELKIFKETYLKLKL